MNSAAATEPFTARRWPAIDLARGIALLAMIIYHFTWDLSFFRYIGAHVATAPGWAWFAKTIAASFLFLSGVSFALAVRAGIRRSAFLRRLCLISAAAIAVSLGTAYAMPQAPVLFGILHCLAASSVLLLLVARLPVWAVLMVAGAIFAGPALFASPQFDGAGLSWLGLNVTPVMAVDHVPLLPWSGWALTGFALMRAMLTQHSFASLRERIAGWNSHSPAARAFVFSGRHSLAVYLLHQPLLMGLLWLGAPSGGDAGDFRASCITACRADAADLQFCERYCDCMRRELSARPLWPHVLRNALTDSEMREADALAQQCQRAP